MNTPTHTPQQDRCPHCGQFMPPESADMPHTRATPKVVKVFVKTPGKPGPRNVAVVQAVDFYREAAC